MALSVMWQLQCKEIMLITEILVHGDLVVSVLCSVKEQTQPCDT